jgi:hypothetical protein
MSRSNRVFLCRKLTRAVGALGLLETMVGRGLPTVTRITSANPPDLLVALPGYLVGKQREISFSVPFLDKFRRGIRK